MTDMNFTSLVLNLVLIVVIAGCRGNNENRVEFNDNKVPVRLKIFDGCAFIGQPDVSSVDIFPADRRAVEEITRIFLYSGITPAFEMYSSNISNALATVIDGKRYVLYDQKFIQDLDLKSSSYWASMSIIAHEIGHLLSLHTFNSDKERRQKELEADKFSGFILYKLGATLEQAKYALHNINTPIDDVLYPSTEDRLAMVDSGWNESANQRYNGAVPPPPKDDYMSPTEFTPNDLVSVEHLDADGLGLWYRNLKYYYGVVTEVDKDFTGFKVHIASDKEYNKESVLESKDNEMDVAFDAVTFGGESNICHVCAMNFRSAVVPGRRIKFATTEAFPGAGTAHNGVFYLIYLKMLPGNSF